MRTISAVFICVALSFGQASKQGPKSVAAKSPEIRVEDKAEDPPEFKREYSAKLNSKPGLTMTLACENSRILQERRCIATIRQPDEKSVSFTVGGTYAAYDSIADKIIDPVIVPEVKRLAAEMHLQDVKYMLLNPSEFKTNDGSRWRKAQ